MYVKSSFYSVASQPVRHAFLSEVDGNTNEACAVMRHKGEVVSEVQDRLVVMYCLSVLKFR